MNLKPAKKALALVFATMLASGLCACAANSADSTAETQTEIVYVDDNTYTLQPAATATPVDGGGATIAFVTEYSNLDSNGAVSAAWNGVSKFSANFNFSAQSFVTADGDVAAALNSAAQSGADMVVCLGDAVATELYSIQSNYPTVSYLVLDAEPHSADYTSYASNANVHCVLFAEEQAGFLAGYAAVWEGYTELGFLGGDPFPGTVRYATGFIQGAEYAAEQQGVQVNIKTWYSGIYQANEDITARMSGWYSDGTQLIFVCDGNLAQSCVQAAQGVGGRVIASDYDHASLDATVLTSAVKGYSNAVQNQLYNFYANGNAWAQTAAGQTERLTVSSGAVGLPQQEWRFTRFTAEEYNRVYQRLRNSTVRVERYSDTGSMPETANVTVQAQN